MIIIIICFILLVGIPSRSRGYFRNIKKQILRVQENIYTWNVEARCSRLYSKNVFFSGLAVSFKDEERKFRLWVETNLVFYFQTVFFKLYGSIGSIPMASQKKV